jgi:hypothetical protein
MDFASLLVAALMATAVLAAVLMFGDEGRGQNVSFTDLMQGTN